MTKRSLLLLGIPTSLDLADVQDLLSVGDNRDSQLTMIDPTTPALGYLGTSMSMAQVQQAGGLRCSFPSSRLFVTTEPLIEWADSSLRDEAGTHTAAVTNSIEDPMLISSGEDEGREGTELIDEMKCVDPTLLELSRSPTPLSRLVMPERNGATAESRHSEPNVPEDSLPRPERQPASIGTASAKQVPKARASTAGKPVKIRAALARQTARDRIPSAPFHHKFGQADGSMILGPLKGYAERKWTPNVPITARQKLAPDAIYTEESVRLADAIRDLGEHYATGRLEHNLIVPSSHDACHFRDGDARWIRDHQKDINACKGNFAALVKVTEAFCADRQLPRLHPWTMHRWTPALDLKGQHAGEAVLHGKTTFDTQYGGKATGQVRKLIEDATFILLDQVMDAEIPDGASPATWWTLRHMRWQEWEHIIAIATMEQLGVTFNLIEFHGKLKESLASFKGNESTWTEESVAQHTEREEDCDEFRARMWDKTRASDRAAGGARPLSPAMLAHVEWTQSRPRVLPSFDTLTEEDLEVSTWVQMRWYKRLPQTMNATIEASGKGKARDVEDQQAPNLGMHRLLRAMNPKELILEGCTIIFSGTRPSSLVGELVDAASIRSAWKLHSSFIHDIIQEPVVTFVGTKQVSQSRRVKNRIELSYEGSNE